MVGLSITGHVNGLITASPDEALAAAAALVAIGGGLKLYQVLHRVGLKPSEFTTEEQREIDFLDEEAPDGFWLKPARGIYAGLTASKFSPAIKPRVRWLKGLWTVDHDINVGREVEPVELVDLTTVKTPTL